MILQVALDLTDIEQAISIAEKAARGGAHWLEVGTPPLIKKEGMRAVELMKRRFPDRKIVADLKTMDTGALEVEMAARHGADVVSILALPTTRPSRMQLRSRGDMESGSWLT